MPGRVPAGTEPGGAPFAIPRPERTLTLLMLGRLRCRGGDTICRIRNVSPGGMRIDTGSPLEEGQPVAIEARGGACIEGRVVWTSGLAAGVAFTESIDLLELLSPRAMQSGAAVVVRSPRFHTSATARLQIDGRSAKLRLVSIWLGGCQIESDVAFPCQVEGCLTIPGLPPLGCTSRWASDGRAGLIFLNRPDFKHFARWLESPDLRFVNAPASASESTLISLPRNF